MNFRHFSVVLMNVGLFQHLILGFYTSSNLHCCLHLVLILKNWILNPNRISSEMSEACHFGPAVHIVTLSTFVAIS